MARALEVAWGVLLIVLAATVLAWITYSYTIATEPPKYPWWWAALMAVLWALVIRSGVRRVRGRSSKTSR